MADRKDEQRGRKARVYKRIRVNNFTSGKKYVTELFAVCGDVRC